TQPHCGTVGPSDLTNLWSHSGGAAFSAAEPETASIKEARPIEEPRAVPEGEPGRIIGVVRGPRIGEGIGRGRAAVACAGVGALRWQLALRSPAVVLLGCLGRRRRSVCRTSL